MKPEFIVCHTGAAFNAKRNRVEHHTFEVVKRDHMLPLAAGGRGFRDIAYNAYIEVDGKVRVGRPDWVAGAHTQGFNSRSLGVCCSGSGDHEPFNDAQLAALVAWCVDKCVKFSIPWQHVIGHREAPAFGADPTPKSCPGKRVDMDMIRERVRAALEARGDDDPPPTRRDGKPGSTRVA